MGGLQQMMGAGTLLMIETGEYSDYSFHGPVRMLKAVTKQNLADAYREQHSPEGPWDEWPEPSGFLPWLIKEGYAEDVEGVVSWHVGSYGQFEP